MSVESVLELLQMNNEFSHFGMIVYYLDYYNIYIEITLGNKNNEEKMYNKSYGRKSQTTKL